MVKDCIIKRNSDSSDFFSDVESSHDESDSDSDYFEEPLKETRNSYFCVTPKNHRLMFVS